MVTPLQTLHVSSRSEREFVDITPDLQNLVGQSGIDNGFCFLFLPHTTAALTVNENWDPDVPRDILLTLNRDAAPPRPEHLHSEGNSAAHAQSVLAGATLTLFIEGGKLVLGSWQGVFLAEFDGPRARRVLVKLLAED